MLIIICGPSGSGKSTIARKFLTDYPVQKEWLSGRFTKIKSRCVAYDLPGNLRVLGNYEYYQMGGLDGFKPYAEVWKFIEENVTKYPFILYEGLLISMNIGHLLTIADIIDRKNVVVFHLTTSLDTCVERIRARNKGSEFKVSTVTQAYNRGYSYSRAVRKHGINVVDITSDNGYDVIRDTLFLSGWKPS